MDTKLLYLENMCALQSDAHVLQIIQEDGVSKVIVDQTVFYPQGGGQPSDKGTIRNEHTLFDVQAVSMENGTVFHKGNFTQGSTFTPQESVTLSVDPALRTLHNKNHTAGHLIDCAIYKLGYNLTSSKAYHFPQGPYVEYQGTLEQEVREQLQLALEKAVNDLVAQALPVKITLIDNDPKKRAMIVADYPPILCGGTHVLNTQEVGHITIRKIKNEKGNLRVSYAAT